MRPGLVLAGFIGAALAGPAQAQQTNPLDNVPEVMPNNIPYGTPISLEDAKQVVAAAEAEAKKRNWPLNIAVVDSGGNLVAFERLDGAQLASIDISQHNARAAVRFRRETKVFENAIQGGFNYILSLDGIIASRGGIPLIKDGKLIGAVGCSGATGAQDEVICKTGAAVINK